MEKRTIIIISLVSIILSFIYIILNYYGYIRYLMIHTSSMNKYIENYKKLDKAHDKRRVIISIIPRGVKSINPVIKSLLDQTVKVDLITIVVPYGPQGSDYDNLSKDSISVFKTAKNYGDLNCIIPTVMRESESDTLIITLGGDTIYGKDFIEQLLDKYDGKIVYNNTTDFIDINKGAVFETNLFKEDFLTPPSDIDANKWINDYLSSKEKRRINYLKS